MNVKKRENTLNNDYFLIRYIDKCFLYQDRGNCSNMSSKYFYDRQDGVCKQFMYGGCGGNDNRFDSKQECDQQCSDAQGNANT